MKKCPTCHEIALDPARMGGWACTNNDCPDFEVVKNLGIDEEEGEGESEG